MSTRAQIAMIHTLKSKLGMTDDEYRVMLDGFGVASSKDLSASDSKAFIEALMSMVTGAGITGFQKRYAVSNEAATYAQQAKIRHLWDKVSRAPEQDRARALDKFIESKFGVSFLIWLPRRDVGKVIHTLKAMQKQPAGKDG